MYLLILIGLCEFSITTKLFNTVSFRAIQEFHLLLHNLTKTSK